MLSVIKSEVICLEITFYIYSNQLNYKSNNIFKLILNTAIIILLIYNMTYAIYYK